MVVVVIVVLGLDDVLRIVVQFLLLLLSVSLLWFGHAVFANVAHTHRHALTHAHTDALTHTHSLLCTP